MSVCLCIYVRMCLLKHASVWFYWSAYLLFSRDLFSFFFGDVLYNCVMRKFDMFSKVDEERERGRWMKRKTNQRHQNCYSSSCMRNAKACLKNEQKTVRKLIQFMPQHNSLNETNRHFNLIHIHTHTDSRSTVIMLNVFNW